MLSISAYMQNRTRIFGARTNIEFILCIKWFWIFHSFSFIDVIYIITSTHTLVLSFGCLLVWNKNRFIFKSRSSRILLTNSIIEEDCFDLWKVFPHNFLNSERNWFHQCLLVAVTIVLVFTESPFYHHTRQAHHHHHHHHRLLTSIAFLKEKRQ